MTDGIRDVKRARHPEEMVRADGRNVLRVPGLAEYVMRPSDYPKWKPGTDSSQMNVYSAMLPTPTASNACNGNGYQRDKSGNVYPTLSGAVGAASMPTPTARDWKHGSAAQVDKPRSENLNDRAAAITGKTKLNPEFVASMMGFPIDWFDLT